MSCGQAAPDEKEFAQDLKKELESEKYNFQVFVAITENTIKDLDRELLDHLKISDYFLFINFRREIISNTHDKQCSYRGSLYTNQELAMACAVGFTSENMLIFSVEVCPTIASEKPSLEVHPLGIGGKSDPARLVFSTAAA